MKSVSKINTTTIALVELLLGVVFGVLFIANTFMSILFSSILLIAILFVCIGYFINAIFLLGSLFSQKERAGDGIHKSSIFLCKTVSCGIIFYFLKIGVRGYLATPHINVHDVSIAFGWMSFFFFVPALVLLGLNMLIIKELGGIPLKISDMAILILPVMVFSFDQSYERHKPGSMEIRRDGKFVSDNFYAGKRVGREIVYSYGNKPYIIIRETSLLDGVKDGMDRQYDADGVIECETMYEKGKQSGVQRFFFKNGSVQSERYYKDDVAYGSIKEYTESGALVFYTARNGGHSIKREYWGNSKVLKRETSRLDGINDGMEKNYYRDGTLQRERMYEKGKPTGFVREYFKNGKVQREFCHKENAISGYWKEYDESGTLVFDAISQKDGRLDTIKDIRKNKL